MQAERYRLRKYWQTETRRPARGTISAHKNRKRQPLPQLQARRYSKRLIHVQFARRVCPSRSLRAVCVLPRARDSGGFNYSPPVLEDRNESPRMSFSSVATTRVDRARHRVCVAERGHRRDDARRQAADAHPRRDRGVRARTHPRTGHRGVTAGQGAREAARATAKDEARL